MDINAAADISGATSLAATGVLTDVRGTLSVDEAAQFDTTLGVTGASTLAAASFSGAIDANSTSDFQGAMNLQAGLTVAGAVDINAAADISGATSLAASGVATAIRGTLSVAEAITMTGATDAAISVSADSLYFRDSDGTMKREAASDYATAIAGDGLAASSGVIAISWGSQRFTKATVDATSGTGSGDSASKIAITAPQLSGSEMVYWNGMLLTAEESSGSAGDFDYVITAAGVITFESEVTDLMDSDDVISVQYIVK